MCPQAEGRVEMPYRKETCPADITRVPEIGVRCAGCIIERDLGTASCDRLRLDGLSLTVIGCGRHPLTRGVTTAPVATRDGRCRISQFPLPPVCGVRVDMLHAH